MMAALASVPAARSAAGATARRSPTPSVVTQRRSGVQRQTACRAAVDAAEQPQMIDNSGCMSQRRGLLLGLGSVLLAAGAAPLQGAAAAEQQAEAAASSSSDELVAFSNPAQRYTLLRPAGWEQVGKAGADALFRDPAQKSTNVGVTVYPVTVSSLEAFGDLPTVGERLLGAEKEKESTLSAVMVEQRARTDPAGGFSIYDFEYELESTRGRKRILSTVTIAGRKLHIANGNLSCGKADSCAAAEGALPLLRAVTQSLTVKP